MCVIIIFLLNRGQPCETRLKQMFEKIQNEIYIEQKSCLRPILSAYEPNTKLSIHFTKRFDSHFYNLDRISTCTVFPICYHSRVTCH